LVEASVDPRIREFFAWAIGGPAWGIDFAVGFDDGPVAIDFADALAEVAD